MAKDFYGRINDQQLRHDTNTKDVLFAVTSEVFNLSELDFDKTGNRYTHKSNRSLCVNTHSSNNQWIITNFKSNNDEGIPAGYSGDVFKILRDNVYKERSEYPELCRHLCSIAGLNPENYGIGNKDQALKPIQTQSTTTQTEYIEPDFVPNDTDQEDRIIRYKHTESESELYWSEVIDNLSVYGITEEILTAYDVMPLKTIKGIDNSKDNNNLSTNIQFNPQKPAVVLRAGQNIKFKRLFKSEYKDFYIRSTGNYVFGYNQLPQEKGNALIICEGERDTLTINSHFNSKGIYAICLNGASANINKKFLAELLDRFGIVALMYDNDKTGQKFMEQRSEQHPELKKDAPAVKKNNFRRNKYEAASQ